MAIVTAGSAYPLDFRALDLTALLFGAPTATSTSLVVDYGDGDRDEFSGFGLTYNAFGEPTGGTMTGYRSYVSGSLVAMVEGVSASAVQFMSYVKNADTTGGIFFILSGDDQITGSAFNDYMAGATGNDILYGLGGDDILLGNDGDDILVGGNGVDATVYLAPVETFTIARTGGGWLVTDKTGAYGTDTLLEMELLQFSNKTVDLRLTDSTVASYASNILRTTAASTLPTLAANGLVTRAAALNAIIAEADATTSVASMSYQFFTGKIPTAAGFDFLVSPTGPNPSNLNSALYTKFDTVNRFINFAANLGKYGEAKDSFAAKYGAMTLAEATKDAYAVIFGATPSDAKVAQLLNGRVDYLASFTGDTATGIGTKAAMVGFLLAAAATENVGVMARSNDAWLTDLSDGSAPYAINILDPSNGYYKTDFIYGG